MKIRRTFFKSLAMKEKALALNHALAGLLSSSLREVKELSALTELQRHYLITETGYVYQHFGFSIFGPNARSFLSVHLSLNTGVADNLLQIWLEAIGYMLLEDFNILKIVTGEPDWEMVDKTFFRDFARRILASESNELTDMGLDAWDENLVGSLCGRATTWILRAQSEKVEAILPDVVTCVHDHALGGFVAHGIAENLAKVAHNPLQILIWRIQFLTSFSDIRQEAKFLVRGSSEELELRAERIAALLALLLPHHTREGTPLLPQSPVTVGQMTTVLRSSYQSPHFDCGLFRTWLGVSDKNLGEDLDALVHQALDAGFLFQITESRNRKSYGLTLVALRTLSPFQRVINEAILPRSPGPTPATTTPMQVCA